MSRITWYIGGGATSGLPGSTMVPCSCSCSCRGVWGMDGIIRSGARPGPARLGVAGSDPSSNDRRLSNLLGWNSSGELRKAKESMGVSNDSVDYRCATEGTAVSEIQSDVRPKSADLLLRDGRNGSRFGSGPSNIPRVRTPYGIATCSSEDRSMALVDHDSGAKGQTRWASLSAPLGKHSILVCIDVSA